MFEQQVFAELRKIANQRAVVKASLVSDAMKAKLLEQLAAQERELDKRLQPPVEPAKASQK